MLGVMVFIVSRVKQSIWKGFRSMELGLKSFELKLKKKGYGKVKEKMMKFVGVIEG